jgi:hypothetical protein
MADRVIRDRRQVDDRVEPLDVLPSRITNVTGPLFVSVRLSAEIATVVSTNIEADNFVAGGLHKRDEYRSDVAAVPVYQHSHRAQSPIAA